MNYSLPTISIVIATFNSDRTIEVCLKSVREQNYPQGKIEIILADGGSTDRTFSLAKKFNVKIIHVPTHLQNAEYNKGVGIKHAKNELLLLIDHDNVLTHKNWLRNMVEPFLEHKEMVGVETLRYHYDPKGSLIDRYFALFAGAEPLVYYVGKIDRLPYLYNTYHIWGKAKYCGKYYLVTFDKDHIPTLGANGFMIRRKLLLDEANADPSHYYHIDVNVDLIRKGFTTYGYTKDTLLHLTGYNTVWRFLYRKMIFMDQFHFQQFTKRRYSVVYDKKDIYRAMLYIIFSITFIVPVIDAVRGFRKVKDIAWFLHPFLCFSLMCIYSYVVIKTYAKKLI